MTKEVFSRSLDYNTGLTGAYGLSASTIKYGAFQGFICQDYTVVQVITNSVGDDVTAQMGLRGVTLSPGVYISMAKGDSIYSIILASGSVILYDLGADLSFEPGVSDLIVAFSTRATVDGAILESTSCIDGPLMLYFKKASFYLTPSAYKGGKLYAQKPITGNGDLTWTRGSDGFRTNASGLIQRVPWNLLQQSETFESASWSKSNVTITANSTTAPNGTTTADSMFEQAVNGLHNIRQSITVISGSTYTLSAYVKANGRDWCIMVAGAGGNGYYFNIASGSVGSQTGGTGTVSNPQIQSVGDGWYRISFQLVAGSTTQGMELWTSTGNGNFSFLGDITKGLYIWGAQLVEGSQPLTYLPTTDRLNFPRLSYMYGSCPAVLLEPQRTNLALRSEEFDNASWLKLGGSSVTANTTTAPDGNSTADTLSLTTNASSSVAQAIVFATTTTITISVYVKVASGTKNFRLRTDNPTTTQSFTATTSWQRFSMTATPTGNTSVYVINDLAGTAGDLFIWGYQVEVGAYPTTYIPTTSATATRVADSFSRSNIYTNGLITASGGTWFVELRNNVAYVRDAASGGLYLDSGAGLVNGFAFRLGSSSARMQIWKAVTGTGINLYTTAADTVKIAIKWDGSTADIFANGTKVVSATSFTTTQMENLGASTSQDVPKFIQQMALYPSPLSDTDCQAMTTI